MSGQDEPEPGIAGRSLTSWAFVGYQQLINTHFQNSWLTPFTLMDPMAPKLHLAGFTSARWNALPIRSWIA